MATKSIVGILTTRLQLESFGFTRGMANAVKSVKRFQTAVSTNLVKSISFASGKMKTLAVKGFGGIIAGATAALSSVVKFAVFITGRFLVALSRLTTALRSIAKATVLVAAGITAAFILLTRSSARSIDAIAKISAKLGIPIKKMKGLEIAASEAGIEFNAFTTGLQRAARRIEEALSGAGVGVKPLEALGLSIKELAALSPDEQILKIADALEQVGRQGQKILIGFGLFDTEGVANILLTADALREAERFAEKMGLTINKIDAAKVEAANDAAGRLKFTFRGLFDILAIKAAPAIEAFSNLAIKKLIEAGGVAEVLSKILSASFDFIQPKILAFADSFAKAGLFIAKRLTAEFGVIALAMADLGDRAVFLKNTMQNSFGIAASAIKIAFLSVKFTVLTVLSGLALALDVVVDDMVKSLNFFIKPLKAGADFLGLDVPFDVVARDTENNLSKFREDLEKQIFDTGEKIEEVWNSAVIDALKFDTKIESTGVDDFIKKTGDSIAKLASESAVSLAQLTTALETALIDIPASERLTALVKDLRTRFEELIAANTKANESLSKMPGLLDDIINKNNEMKDVAVDVANTVADVYAGIMVNTVDDASRSLARSMLFAENAFIGLRNVALRMIEDIIAAFIRLAAFKFLASLFPGGGAISQAINFATGGISGVSKATVSAPGLSTPSLAGGGGATVNVNFFGDTMGDDAIEEQVFKGISKAQPALTSAAVSATSNRAQRDPNFRRAFG